ncbi:DUF6188 family protein [Hymenobacter cellulosilyticus]|uniref:DUF6188 family protein n=1 Tax=Hymenobacter cellulosilyticus TaxID=2932248 RepID=A0A8T9QC08_9BACT|nr:DUF6188 family protein [Hymenobacter cellulosilyticus]UOQ73658.1 DUF6188 family protein [Hymenobacter cellulosilyticus]
MALKKKNGGFELPIIGLRVAQIVYSGRLKLVFDDAEQSRLDLDGAFSITRYDQTIRFEPLSKEAYMCGYDILSLGIKAATGGTHGTLLLVFENGWELYVEDGPYENWHYTKRSLCNPSANLYVHGGVGQTSY